MHRRGHHAFVWMLALSPVLILLAVFLGDGWTRPWTLFEADQAGILELRIWRVALGALVGASLAAAGAVLQTLLRNPLAEPYVLGLSSGAGLATVIAIVAGLSAWGVFALPAAGFFGALISLFVVYRLARSGGGATSHALILAGVIWGSLCGSVLMFLVSQSTAEGLHAVMWWMLGDLQVYDVRLLGAVAAINGLALVVLGFIARDLNVMWLGEENAGHIGLNPERLKMMALALSAVLAASAVSVSGLIAFVGLVAPHAVRALVGPDHRRLLPACALAGAAFLVWADGIGRTILYPVEVPVGVLTALTGAPFFLILLKRRQRFMWR